MKTLTTALCITFLTIAFFACDSKETIPVDVDPKPKPFVANPQDTISLNRFNTWTDNWLAYGKDYMSGLDTIPFFYTMPLVDLTQIIGENPTKARFYMGLRMDTIPNIPHLIVVGVDANDNDMLNYNKGQYAYDVSLPCPAACFGGKPPIVTPK